MSNRRLEEMEMEGRRRLTVARQELQTVHPRKVLIVDDDVHVVDEIVAMLEPHDCEITIAYSGAKAIDLVDNLPFDLMLLDLKLPGITGIEVLRALRPTNPTLRVVVITNYADSPMVMEALTLGTLTVILKPVTPANLAEIFNEP